MLISEGFLKEQTELATKYFANSVVGFQFWALVSAVQNQQNVKWFLQGAVVGAVTAPFAIGIYLYFGWLMLIVGSIVATFKSSLVGKLRLWGFLAGSTCSALFTLSVL
ncbi:MAG: hypothetical protein Q7T36_13000 [Fluviicoccus sp.]|uniref:hypothetical protein n=1 Tax=Fluviicoccus sp. TaxID=2003552 RepID=UPI002716832E|nr:hypothetical protein [Fluviicoccus sp.]MDO8331375.1 hypothetical protein [Fluviicoccus sp.]